MSQQKPTENGIPFQSNINQIRRLFVQTGFGFKEIANSRGVYQDSLGVSVVVARIVEEYTPPTPSVKFAEIKVADAPSRIHMGGKSSYKMSLRLMFPDKLSYNDFIFLCGNEMKYYDEKGNIYKCTLSDAPTTKRVEAGRRYDVTLNIVGVKKDTEEDKQEINFTDVNTSTVYKLSFDSHNTFGKVYVTINDISFSVYIYPGSTSLMISQLVATGVILSGALKYVTLRIADNSLVLVPKQGYSLSQLSLDPLNTNVEMIVLEDVGGHWAKEYIDNCTKLGLVAQYDASGNQVYTFSPESFATRGQMAAFVNRLRKYVGRVLRG